MSMQLTNRVSSLEAEVKAMRETINGLIAAMTEGPRDTPPSASGSPSGSHFNPNGPRRMCPKCGVKPNYHLHVINCRGPWQGDGAQT